MTSPAVSPNEWNTGSTLNTLVLAVDRDAREALHGIRQHVLVREDDALRQPLGTRCEQDRRRIIGIALHLQAASRPEGRVSCPRS